MKTIEMRKYKLKIHFSNVNFSSSSGPNTFAHRLASALTKRGHEIVSERSNYDVFLCFIEPASIPKSDCKFIHRLDGIWFKPEEFETNNSKIKWAYDSCDHVIWQSQFDKSMTQKWWGQTKGSVIHNGIQLKKAKDLHPKIDSLNKRFDRIFVCAASWHRQKRLKENIEFFQKNRNSNDALFILGKNPDFLVKDENIVYFGLQPHDICLQMYSIADWFLHLAWLDHCPNVVVEALSQGCPIICTDSGGTKEIVKNMGVIIPEDNIYNYELTDYDKPYDIKIKKINLDRKININTTQINIENVASKYEELF